MSDVRCKKKEGLTDVDAASPLRHVSSLHAKIQNDIIQTNNLAKNDKIQGNKSSKVDKNQRNNAENVI
jgi:hypothetical protein